MKKFLLAVTFVLFVLGFFYPKTASDVAVKMAHSASFLWYSGHDAWKDIHGSDKQPVNHQTPANDGSV